MTLPSIPVDLSNPGQVFACLGFLEAAELLLGNARGGFEWADSVQPRFTIQASGEENPFCAVLDFLSTAQIHRIVAQGAQEQEDPCGSNTKGKSGKTPKKNLGQADNGLIAICTFPCPKSDPKTLPLRLQHGSRRIDMTHWCDGSSRNPFKLFAGQQASYAIVKQMLDKIRALWRDDRENFLKDPFGLTAPLGGSSFKFDPRKSWTGIDAGYSPDEQSHDLEASPVVEVLAALGLENARPDEFETRQVRYGVWRGLLPPILARPALAGMPVAIPLRVFRFTLELAGKNKIVTFAQEEKT